MAIEGKLIEVHMVSKNNFKSWKYSTFYFCFVCVVMEIFYDLIA
jgi:hypothetical protein